MSTIIQSGGDLIITLTERDKAYVIVRIEGVKEKRIEYIDSGNDGIAVIDQWESCPTADPDDHLPPNLYQVEHFDRSSRNDRTIILKPRYQEGDCSNFNPTLTFSSIQEVLHIDAMPKTTTSGFHPYRISQWLLTIGGQPGERATITIVLQDDDFGGGL